MAFVASPSHVTNLYNTEVYPACVFVEYVIFVAPLSVCGGVVQVGV